MKTIIVTIIFCTLFSFSLYGQEKLSMNKGWSFKKAARLAGIPEVRLHDLRHTFATRLIESGVDIITLRDLLGHSQSAVTERYPHPNESLKRVAVDALT